MMTEAVKEALRQEVHNDFHEKLLHHCVDLVQFSRDRVQQNYANWDQRQRVYDGERLLDEKDRKAMAQNEPTKMYVPMSTAQVNTFISFCLMLYNQKSRFYEFDPSGSEDFILREPSEMLLERDLKHNKFRVLLYQFLLDLARFGLGIFKHQWVEDKKKILLPTQSLIFDQVVDGESTYQDVPCFFGNRIEVISPYKFFPDVRMPLTRMEEGEFCASEDEFTKTKLKRMEANGEVVGIEHLQPFTKERLYRRNRNEDYRFNAINKNSPDKDTHNYCITECQVWLVPSEFDLGDGKKMGEEDFPVLYVVSYSNDERIIRAEPMNNYHSGFTYEAAQFTPDQHKLVSKSLADMVGPLQELIDWYLNARVTSVKKSLENNLVVDPRYVNMRTLTSRSSVVELSREVGRRGINQVISPLPIQDYTAGHFEDIGRLSAIMQQATGVNDTALGQAQLGRRSATEMRAVIQGGANRTVVYASLIWEQALAPLGNKMLMNHRQNVDEQTFKGVVGDTISEEIFNQFKSSAQEVIGKTDLFIFDGILPSEKAFMAQSLQELLAVALQAPEIVAREGWDLTKMLKEIFELRGLTGLERFKMTPEEQHQAMLRQLVLQNGERNGNGTGAPAVSRA